MFCSFFLNSRRKEKESHTHTYTHTHTHKTAMVFISRQWLLTYSLCTVCYIEQSCFEIEINKWCWHNWRLSCRRMRIDPFLSPCTKVKSKWIKELHIKSSSLWKPTYNKKLETVFHSLAQIFPGLEMVCVCEVGLCVCGMCFHVLLSLCL
jgi:hypothetical protein